MRFNLLSPTIHNQAAISNDANQMLLKRDLLSKLRLEYELWCPLCESFAPNPFDNTVEEISKIPCDVSSFPHPVSMQHFRKCAESRKKMQEQVLGFVPKFDPISVVASKSRRWAKDGQSFFQELSSAMEKLYIAEYAVSDVIYRQRERVRASIEHTVSASGAFPLGTRVAVFGSAANGFG